MELKKRCKNCRRVLPPNPHVKNYQYCNRKACQRARKARWQRKKMSSDPDYLKNQQESQQIWRSHNSDYWCGYRDTHDKYQDRNRQLQKVRDAKRRAKHLAKMDASDEKNDMMPGTYYLIPVQDDLAKMDASIRKIFIIPDSCLAKNGSCKKAASEFGCNWQVDHGVPI